MSLKSVVRRLVEGLRIDGFTVYAKDVSRGRFVEEVNLDLYLRRRGDEAFLLCSKVFYGRKPYYRSWVELFNVNNRIALAGQLFHYYDSPLEDGLLSLFTSDLEPGGRIYVEYYGDFETLKQLEVGFPPPVTRLGYKLFKLGLFLFKDIYFPEGYMEGGQKLQAEKPLNEEIEAYGLTRIRLEVEDFLRKAESYAGESLYASALERGEAILSALKSR